MNRSAMDLTVNHILIRHFSSYLLCCLTGAVSYLSPQLVANPVTEVIKCRLAGNQTL